MKELKKKYNALLKRHNRASDFFDDNSIPIVERKRHIQAFREIIEEMESVLKYINCKGYSPTEKEMLEGFKLRQT